MANQLATGWEDVGNNLYRNTANSQVVDYNHPIYQDALSKSPQQQTITDYAAPQAAAPSATPAPAAPGATAPAAPAPPTPSSPKPGPNWVPTQDGMGWVPADHPAAWQAPVTAAPMAQAAPAAPQAAPAPTDLASREAALGIVDKGNGMVFLPSYGGMVDRNNPMYKAAMQQAAAASPTGTAAAPGAGDPVNDAFRSTLLQLMGQKPEDVSNDPALQAQISAYSTQAQLARRQRQESSAERMAAQGLGDSGAMDSEVASSFEDMGHDVAGYAANATGQEIAAKRDQLKMALALAGDRINAQERNALEKQLAEMDAAVKREGISSQQQLGAGDLDLRRYLGDGQMSLGLLQALMGNEQFNNDLGFRIGNAEAGYNRDALLSLFK